MLAMKTIIADSENMAPCVNLRDDIRSKFDRLNELLLRGPLAIMSDVKPIQALIDELVNDLGDPLPATSASALIDVNCLAEKKEENTFEPKNVAASGTHQALRSLSSVQPSTNSGASRRPLRTP